MGFFIDHKLLDEEGFFEKYQTSIFARNRCGLATPLGVAKHNWKNLEIFNDHKPPLDGERIL